VSERNSEYKRQPADTYVTPGWVWDALYEVESWARTAFDCCPENASFDFLTHNGPYHRIATNPPYNIADKIVRHALALTKPNMGRVAMLLPMAFDCAKGRVDIFRDHPAFDRKLVLMRRIRWANLPQSKAGPSMNHAWFVWKWDVVGVCPTVDWHDGVIE
jgi:hypothetical protein